MVCNSSGGYNIARAAVNHVLPHLMNILDDGGEVKIEHLIYCGEVFCFG